MHDSRKKSREPHQGLERQCAAAVVVVPSRRIRVHEKGLVSVDASGESSGEGPRLSPMPSRAEPCVRHQPRDAAIPIEERVNPEKTVMRGGRGDDLLCPRHSSRVVRLGEADQQCVKRIRIGGNQAANLDRSISEDARVLREGVHPCPGSRPRGDHREVDRQNSRCIHARYSTLVTRGLEILTRVDELLHVDVRDGLMLEISLPRIGRVVVPQRAIDVARMSVVPLDEVRVVAVHRADEPANACLDGLGQPSAQCARPSGRGRRRGPLAAAPPKAAAWAPSAPLIPVSLPLELPDVLASLTYSSYAYLRVYAPYRARKRFPTQIPD